MNIVEVCRISAKKLVDYQQLLRSINRTLVNLKRARENSLIEDLKKKIKAVEKELATIGSTSLSF